MLLLLGSYADPQGRVGFIGRSGGADVAPIVSPPFHTHSSPPDPASSYSRPSQLSGRSQSAFHGFSGGLVTPYVVPYPVYPDVGAYPDASQVEPQRNDDPADAYQAPSPNVPIGIPQRWEPPAAQESPPPSHPLPAASENVQVMFFIALKNHWVYTAIAYWMQGATLHYITPQGVHNQVSLTLVDRKTSAKLNEGRLGEFALPPQ